MSGAMHSVVECQSQHFSSILSCKKKQKMFILELVTQNQISCKNLSECYLRECDGKIVPRRLLHLYEDGTCLATPCTARQGPRRVIFLKSLSEGFCGQWNSFSFVRRGYARNSPTNDNTSLKSFLKNLTTSALQRATQQTFSRDDPKSSKRLAMHIAEK